MTDQPTDQPGADNAPDIPDDALEPDGELGPDELEGAGPEDVPPDNPPPGA